MPEENKSISDCCGTSSPNDYFGKKLMDAWNKVTARYEPRELTEKEKRYIEELNLNQERAFDTASYPRKLIGFCYN